MATPGGGQMNPGGSGHGPSGGGGSGSGGKKSQDPSVPRCGPWQDKPRTESQWDQEPPRPSCISGSCTREQHEHSGESNYTHK
ncbi:hypothetical protein DHEL01_v210382 [Diaporthe helianthi]|uniref:Uncharacterized protein n=1 Tax=Diaporthe helianthi TaxID=158607 RepID=A0A2P5HLS6_DIAHE|nr:hypothetical protein DHEL01_v210382 [Diaporthe helianthi]